MLVSHDSPQDFGSVPLTPLHVMGWEWEHFSAKICFGFCGNRSENNYLSLHSDASIYFCPQQFISEPIAISSFLCHQLCRKSDGSTPNWKAEVEQRKKSKSYVVAHKPEQPIRLGETPEWKKQLNEKKKTKRTNSVDNTEPQV